MESGRQTFLIATAIAVALAFTGLAAAQNPVPLISQPLTPDATKPGGSGFLLTVNGAGFVPTSVVNWNGSIRATTFVSKSQLRATILATDIAKAGTASVTVINPAPGGGVSNPAFFPVSLPVNFVMSGSAFPSGTGPGSVGTADFNGDGKLDLVVGDPGSGNVSVLLGNGNGTFHSPISYAVGQAASFQFFQVAVGDLNGDGKMDFVVSDFDDNYVSVFIGNGDGTFKPGVTYVVGPNPTSVAVADVNRDGKLDILTSNQNCPNGCGVATVSVLLGNGDGTFLTHSEFAAGQTANWVTVGDFNRDGKLDLAVVNGNAAGPSAVLILLGKGDGTFQTPVSYPLSTNGVSAATADLNGDGKLDLAVVDNIGLISIYLGNGDGTFRPRTDYSTGSFPWGSLGIGDFNQDGHLDLAIATSGSSSASVLLGNGDGTFQPQIQVGTGSSPCTGSIQNCQGVVAGDFKRDGHLDLAIANYDDNTVSILLQDGTIALNPPNLNFGVQVTGSTKKVTLTNVGTTPVTIDSIAISGVNVTDFTQSNTCGSSLGAGAHCTISVTFTPSQLGPQTAVIDVTDSAPGSPQSVLLSGIGVISGPDATLSATSLTFATQLVGTTSAAQSVTLTNYGTAALSITSVSFTGNDPGDFAQSNSCGSSVAPGASCTISVTFTPKQSGSPTATLAVTDNALGSPQTVGLKGTGTVVELNPTSMSFGIHPVGTTTTRSTTLTNIGRTALSITTIVMAGADPDEFRQTNTCGTSVGAGKSCSITVSFHPIERGGDSAEVSISDNGGGSQQQVPLSGAGCTYYHGHCKTAANLGSPAMQSALRANSAAALPRPSGSSPVGTQVIDLADATRDDPFLADGTKRELLVRFWYPADLSRGCTPAEYTSPRVWSYFSKLAALPLPEVTTNSCLEAPITEGTHPVVVFTHGYTATFTDYSFIFEDLASRGYLVASVDHTYEATAVEFPDKRFVKSLVGTHLANTWQTDDQTLSSALSVRLDDLKFVIDELSRLNVSTGNAFTGKLDLTQLALGGHSLGGLSTLFGVQRDARFKAAVLLDPYLPDIPLGSTETAVMLLTMGREQRNEDECDLWSDLRGPRLAVNFQGAEHVTPSDLVWLAKGAIQTGAMGPERTIEALREYIAAFLDANLRGKPLDPLLTGPSSTFPYAEVTTQKQSPCGEAVPH